MRRAGVQFAPGRNDGTAGTEAAPAKAGSGRKDSASQRWWAAGRRGEATGNDNGSNLPVRTGCWLQPQEAARAPCRARTEKERNPPWPHSSPMPDRVKPTPSLVAGQGEV